jgi:multidrug efflux pump subunit AcrA (membrane-fusion protein)
MLLTLDNQIDTTTGTVKARASFDNKDAALFPNEFVNVRLLVDTLGGTTLIPASTIQHNGQAAFDSHQPRLNASLPQTLCRVQHLIAAGSHANVLGEVDPTHHSRRVHQELCGPGDVMPVSRAAHVQQIVTAYHLRVWIGKKSESVTCLPA